MVPAVRVIAFSGRVVHATMIASFSPGHITQLTRLRALLTESGLESYAGLIETKLRPAIGLRTRLPTAEDLTIGATRFGGEPDAPESFVWPTSESGPVMLIAQIRLPDLVPFDVENLLPKGMLLSVFADTSGWPAYVYLFEEGTPLVRHARPPEVTAAIAAVDDWHFRAAGVDVEAQLHLPEDVDWPADGPLERRDADNRYYDMRCAYEAELFPISSPVVGGQGRVPGSPAVHQMLGRIPSNSAYADSAEGGSVGADEEALLAFDSDYLVGMEFGDSQRVWLLVDRAKLAHGDFSALRCAL